MPTHNDSPRPLPTASQEISYACRYCGSAVTQQHDGHYFLCPVHGDIPPEDVGKIAAQQRAVNEDAQRVVP